MGQVRGPLDRGEHIGTRELLEAIEAHGPRWTVPMSVYSIAAVSAAVGREIEAGHLRDGKTITAKGHQALEALRRVDP